MMSIVQDVDRKGTATEKHGDEVTLGQLLW